MDYSKFSDETLKKIAQGHPLDYANLSTDELKELATAQPQEKTMADTAKETAQDAGMGAVQGGTLGFADEAGAGLQTGMDYLQSLGHKYIPGSIGPSPTDVDAELAKEGFKGDVGPTNEADFYKTAQKENQAKFKEAKDRSPIAYTAGEFAGGLVPGAGAAKLAAPLISGAGALGAELGGSLGGTTGRVLASGATGAALGATAGAGSSQGNIIGGDSDDQNQVEQDAIHGGEVGGVLGTAVPAASELAGSALDATVGQTDLAKKLALFYNKGKQGVNLNSEAAQTGTLSNPASLDNALSTEDTRSARTILDKINMADEKLGQNVGQTLQDATDQGIQVKIQDSIKKSSQSLMNQLNNDSTLADNPKFQGLVEKLNRLNSGSEVPGDVQNLTGSLNPIELQSLRNDLANYGRAIAQKDPNVSHQVFDFVSELTGTLKENVPGYANAAERMNQFRKFLPETLLSRDNPADITNLRVSGTKNVDVKLLSRLRDMLQGLNDPSASSQVDKGAFTNLLKGIQTLNANETVKKSAGEIGSTIFDDMGMQPQDIEQYIKQKAFQSNALQNYTGQVAKPNTNSLSQTLDFGQKALEWGANKAGLVANKVAPTTSASTETNPVVNTSRKLYSASDDALKDFSAKLKDIPGQNSMSEALNDALNSNNSNAKNAILFSILQNPNLRSLIDSNNLTQKPE